MNRACELNEVNNTGYIKRKLSLKKNPATFATGLNIYNLKRINLQYRRNFLAKILYPQNKDHLSPSFVLLDLFVSCL